MFPTISRKLKVYKKKKDVYIFLTVIATQLKSNNNQFQL